MGDIEIKELFSENAEAEYAMNKRANFCNEGVHLAKQLVAEGRALIVAPDGTCGVEMLSRDAEPIKRLYRKDYEDGAAIKTFLEM